MKTFVGSYEKAKTRTIYMKVKKVSFHGVKKKKKITAVSRFDLIFCLCLYGWLIM
jgi:hypothetical protein